MHTVTRTTRKNVANKNLVQIFNNEVYVSVRNAKVLCGYNLDSGHSIILDKVSKDNIVKQINFTKKGKESETYYLTIAGFCELAMNISQKDKRQNAELALKMISDIADEFDVKTMPSSLFQFDNKPIETRLEVGGKEIATAVAPWTISGGTLTISGASKEGKTVLDIDKTGRVYIDAGHIATGVINTTTLSADNISTETLSSPYTLGDYFMTDDEKVDEIIDLVGAYSQETKPRWKALYDELDLSLDESIRRSWQRYKRDNGINITILNYIRNHTSLLLPTLQAARKLFG